MAIYLTDFSRALIRWIPEHFLGHTRYSNGALREAANELRQAATALRTRPPLALPRVTIPRRPHDWHCENNQARRLVG